MISNLKDEVIPEEVVLAKEALKKRDKQADESYSDYKMALKVIVQRAYNSYDQTEVDGKVLERFLDGLGKAGRAVRLQAPTTVEDAIAKAIAYEMETSHMGNAGQVFLSGSPGSSFIGYCNMPKGPQGEQMPNTKVKLQSSAKLHIQPSTPAGPRPATEALRRTGQGKWWRKWVIWRRGNE
jgi:hypothetical protein